jgi:hypothetical protein
MRLFLRIGIVLIVISFASCPLQTFVDDPNSHNTISQEDDEKIIELWHRAVDFAQDLPQTVLGMKGSLPDDPESYRTIWCIDQIHTQALFIEHQLYGLVVAAGISDGMQYKIDEKLTLGMVKTTLEAALNSVTHTRGELNRIIGGCARQRRLPYDKATSLLTQIEEVGRVLAPMLPRVQINMFQR